MICSKKQFDILKNAFVPFHSLQFSLSKKLHSKSTNCRFRCKETSLTELNIISSVNVNCTHWVQLKWASRSLGSCCYNKVGYLEASFKVEFMGINDHAHKLNSRVLTAVKNEIPYLYTSLGLEVFLQPQLLQSNAIQIRHASLRHLSIGFIYLPTEATFISYTVYGTTIRGVVLCPVGSHGSSVVSLFQCKTQYRGKKYRNT